MGFLLQMFYVLDCVPTVYCFHYLDDLELLLQIHHGRLLEAYQ